MIHVTEDIFRKAYNAYSAAGGLPHEVALSSAIEAVADEIIADHLKQSLTQPGFVTVDTSVHARLERTQDALIALAIRMGRT